MAEEKLYAGGCRDSLVAEALGPLDIGFTRLWRSMSGEFKRSWGCLDADVRGNLTDIAYQRLLGRVSRGLTTRLSIALLLLAPPNEKLPR